MALLIGIPSVRRIGTLVVGQLLHAARLLIIDRVASILPLTPSFACNNCCRYSRSERRYRLGLTAKPVLAACCLWSIQTFAIWTAHQNSFNFCRLVLKLKLIQIAEVVLTDSPKRADPTSVNREFGLSRGDRSLTTTKHYQEIFTLMHFRAL